MKGLATLIKLHKRTLDELRRKMGVLENQKAAHLRAIEKMRQELAQETELARKQPDMAMFFGDFAQRIKNRQIEITKEIMALDKQMDTLRDEIAVAFGEMKKYEIALENSKKRKADEQNRKDTIMLDEIAAQQHRRKTEPQS